MKVALLAPLFESVPPRYYGGTERVVDHLCRGLIDRGIEVSLFASGDSCSGVKAIAVTGEALRLKQPRVQDPVPYHLKMLSLVADRAQEFDLIHNHHDYWMFPLSKLTQVPILNTLHGRLDSLDLLEAFEGYPAVHQVSISNAQRKPLEHLQSIRWAQTVYNGIDVESYQFHEKPGSYLAFLGRISPEKRPEWAIEIAQRSGVPLKIAAKIEAGASQDYYDTFVKPHVDGKFIEYLGEISEAEKSDFLGQALGLAFPIDWPEPFGLVMVEALACGTPVLARPCGSVNEILQDGVTGFCDLSVPKLAQKVEDLCKIDRKICRSWVKERFSLERMTEEYVNVYRRLTGKSKDSLRRGADHHRWDLLHPIERSSDGDPKDQLQG